MKYPKLIDAGDVEGATPLHYSALNNTHQITVFLLKLIKFNVFDVYRHF